MGVTLEEAITEWIARDRRRFGCVSAANWFCRRVEGFSPLRLTRNVDDVVWQHVVITNGTTIFDPSPWSDRPDE